MLRTHIRSKHQKHVDSGAKMLHCIPQWYYTGAVLQNIFLERLVQLFSHDLNELLLELRELVGHCSNSSNNGHTVHIPSVRPLVSKRIFWLKMLLGPGMTRKMVDARTVKVVPMLFARDYMQPVSGDLY